MYKTALEYSTKRPKVAIAAIIADPREAWTRFYDVYTDRRERRRRSECPYEPIAEWEQWLHTIVGADWPCEERSEFLSLWRKVIADLTNSGVDVGPESFKHWNDGDTGLVRAIWCLTRHLRPK